MCQQLQSLLFTTAPKIHWKIYFLYDFWCAQTCRSELFLDYLYELWQLRNVRKKYYIGAVVHIYILGPKLLQWNFLQISQLSTWSGAHKLCCWLRHNFCQIAVNRNLAKTVAQSGNENGNSLVYLKGQSLLKKRWTQSQNRPIKRDSILIQSMSPSNEQHAGLGAWRTKKHTNTTFLHLQPVCIVRSPPNFVWWQMTLRPFKKVWNNFWSNAYFFSYRGTENLW